MIRRIILALFLSVTLAFVSYASVDEEISYIPILKRSVSEQTRGFGDMPSSYGPYVPHEGHVRVPVILVDYPDRPFTFSLEDLYDIYMGNHPKDQRPVKVSSFSNYASAREYFYESSFGKLEFEFEFYGPYTLSHQHEYYGDKQDPNTRRIGPEVFAMADADIDFSLYDNDGDNICELVYILYAGVGANGGEDPDAIWACCATTSTYTTDEGVRLRRFGTSNELLLAQGNKHVSDHRAVLNGCGTFCHEMGHALGLPDLYCNNDSWPIHDNIGPEDWDLMDGGLGVCNGFRPPLLASWERLIFDWIKPVELTAEQEVTVWPLNDEAGRGEAYVVRNPANHDEFWTIENIPSTGWYAGLYGGGTGIIITHINYSDAKFRVPNCPNSTFGAPDCTLLPADGYLLSYYYINQQHPDGFTVEYSMYCDNLRGDTYPGATGATSLAAYKNYAGDEDLVNTMPITNIRLNDDGSVSFHFGGDPAGIHGIESPVSSASTYMLDGRFIIEKAGLQYNVIGQRIF